MYIYSIINLILISMIEMGISLLYSIGSMYILVTAFLRQKKQNYQRLLDGQSNRSDYGAIEQTFGSDEDEDEDATLVPDDGIARNKIYDYSRLFFSLTIWGLFCFLTSIIWKNYEGDRHGYYLIISHVIKNLIWVTKNTTIIFIILHIIILLYFNLYLNTS